MNKEDPLYLYVESKNVCLDLESYEEGRTYLEGGFLLKDSYNPSRTKQFHGKYSIAVESPTINDDESLVNILGGIQIIINRITSLWKLFFFTSFNTPLFYLDSFTKTVIETGVFEEGWKSNYAEVKEYLDRDKGLRVNIKMEIEHYVKMHHSPFNEIVSALNVYESLRPEVLALLELINDADMASYSSRYLIIGKALEIVDGMYPLEKRTDNRIQKYFPELSPHFKGYSIKKLLTLANQRQEARHYVLNKRPLIIHQSMSDEELKDYYNLANMLCINVIRRAMGLNISIPYRI